jgi:ribose-phosphate pyrophosphokinase
MLNLNVTLTNSSPDFGIWTFPGGEVGVIARNPHANYGSVSTLIARVSNPTDLLALLMVRDTLENPPNRLYLPYLPYGRQDRYTEKGGTFSLKIICQLIDNIGFKTITILDPHSDVSAALFRNTQVIVKDSLDILIKYKGQFDAIMAPDTGAIKRTTKAADCLGIPFLFCLKERVSRDRISITPPDIKEMSKYKNILVYDDICDGGGTFIALAKEVQKVFNEAGLQPPDLHLFVTHGIFSKGNLSNFNGLFKTIITTNSWQSFGASWLNWSAGKFIVEDVFKDYI